MVLLKLFGCCIGQGAREEYGCTRNIISEMRIYLNAFIEVQSQVDGPMGLLCRTEEAKI